MGKGPKYSLVTVRTAKITDRTFIISAIVQVISCRLTLPETILGNFWLAEYLQYLRTQNCGHSVYRTKVVLGIV